MQNLDGELLARSRAFVCKAFFDGGYADSVMLKEENLILEQRWSKGGRERRAALVDELESAWSDVIVTGVHWTSTRDFKSCRLDSSCHGRPERIRVGLVL